MLEESLRQIIREELRAQLKEALELASAHTCAVHSQTEWVSIQKAAAHFDMKPRSIKKMIAEGLPSIGQGRGRRVRVEDVRQHLEQPSDDRDREARIARRVDEILSR